jgi:hypothetical protein
MNKEVIINTYGSYLHVKDEMFKEVIDLSKDKVYLFQFNKSELKATVQLGKAFDPALITDEIKLLFI